MGRQPAGCSIHTESTYWLRGDYSGDRRNVIYSGEVKHPVLIFISLYLLFGECQNVAVEQHLILCTQINGLIDCPQTDFCSELLKLHYLDDMSQRN